MSSADKPEGLLTVAAVAARLGVAAATLRTWDRRYGLGPSDRVAGRHRRYSPDDLARLETMRALTERGVALADAARIAQRSVPTEERAEDLDALSLAAAAVEQGSDRLVRSLRLAAERMGVLDLLVQRVTPARELLNDVDRADAPGRDPELALVTAMLAVVRERVANTPVTRAGWVLVAAGRASALDAHVLACALTEAGVRARVALTSPVDPPQHRRCRGAALVIEICDGESRAPVRRSSREHALLLVGSGPVRSPGVHRVRTLAAALPEALDILRERLGGDDGGPVGDAVGDTVESGGAVESGGDGGGS